MKYPFLLTSIILFLTACNDQDSTMDTPADMDSVTKTEPPPILEEYVFIKNITGNNGNVIIHADYIQFLTNEEATEAAKRMHQADTVMIDGKMSISVPNDYFIINEDSTTQLLQLDPGASFELLVEMRRASPEKVTNSLEGLQLIYSGSPFILTVQNGKIIKVEEVFIP